MVNWTKVLFNVTVWALTAGLCVDVKQSMRFSTPEWTCSRLLMEEIKQRSSSTATETRSLRTRRSAFVWELPKRIRAAQTSREALWYPAFFSLRLQAERNEMCPWKIAEASVFTWGLFNCHHKAAFISSEAHYNTHTLMLLNWCLVLGILKKKHLKEFSQTNQHRWCSERVHTAAGSMCLKFLYSITALETLFR